MELELELGAVTWWNFEKEKTSRVTAFITDCMTVTEDTTVYSDNKVDKIYHQRLKN